MAKKLEKMTDKHRVLLALEKAVTDYDRSRGDARWSSKELDEIAKSAAIQQGLSYDGADVDPAIVLAIRITADTKRTYVEQKQAREDAWKAYSAHN